jgi:LysW-gamma-L-lysine carboxypeptidase
MEQHFTVTTRHYVKTLERALKLYTPSLREKSLADFLATVCEDLGFRDIHTDDVGNIIATKGSGSPKIMLCGHMDTVPGRIKVRKEENYLFGRGSSDAKGPLIAMLFAAASVEKNNGTVTFVGAVDEEGNATGIKSLTHDKPDVDYAIFGEPSGTKQITIGYKGRIAINLKINVGDSAHASAPWLAKNAIEESSLFLNQIKNKLESGQEEKTKGMILTATITEIKGGLSHNVTPRECDSTLDIRIPVGTNCKLVEEKLSKVVKEISKSRGVEAFYSIIDETEPFEAQHSSPLVRALTLAVLDIEKQRPTLIRKTGTGDMNVIGNKLSIPVVTYGPGDPHAAHTIDEKISIDEYLRGIEVLKRTIQHLKRLDDKIK